MDYGIKYVLYELGGSFAHYSQAYYIADDRVYFVDHVYIDQLLNDLDEILLSAQVVKFDTTGLDFNEHRENDAYLIDCPRLYAFQFVEGEWRSLWGAWDWDQPKAVKTIMDLFKVEIAIKEPPKGRKLCDVIHDRFRRILKILRCKTKIYYESSKNKNDKCRKGKRRCIELR